MRSIRVLAGVALAVALTGCINSATVIKVNPDGSGTVEQTTLMNLAALKSMLPPGATQTSGPGVVTEADLKRTAEKMGKGVRLVSSTPAKENGFEGTKAIFAFDDINQVQISQDPAIGGANPDVPPTAPEDDPVRFKLTRQGGTSLLTITIQEKPGAGKDTPQTDMPDMADPMMMGMLKTMFQGFRINIALDVAGSIVKTNADYVSGSRVTLLEMDMAALLEDEAKFKELQKKLGPDATLSTVKPYLKDIKGIKVDGPVINIEFR